MWRSHEPARSGTTAECPANERYKMSQLRNYEYEAMTPREKVMWHFSQAAAERVWYKRGYKTKERRFLVCTAASEREAQRHERCAELLINHYRLKA